MNLNPRPIPIDFDLIADIVDETIDGLEMLMSLYKRTKLAKVPFDELEDYVEQQVLQGKYPARVMEGFESFGPTIHPRKHIPAITPFSTPRVGFRRTFYNVKGRKIDTYEIELEFETPSEPTSAPLLGGAWIDVKSLPSRKMVNANYSDQNVRNFLNEYYDFKRKRNEGQMRFRFNASLTPNFFMKLFKDSRRLNNLKRELRSTLVHEFTHAYDLIPKTYFSTDNWYEYLNQKIEVRAELQVVIDRMKDFFTIEDPNAWGTYGGFRDAIASQPIDKALGYFLPNHWEDYTEKNQLYFLSGMVQWLNENGFKLPKRRF